MKDSFGLERGAAGVKSVLQMIEHGRDRTFLAGCSIGRRLNEVRLHGGSVEIEALAIDDDNDCAVRESCADCHIGKGILATTLTSILGGDVQMHHAEHLLTEYGKYGNNRLLPLSCPVGSMLARLEQDYGGFGHKAVLFVEVAAQNSCNDTGTCLQCPLGQDQFADLLLRLCEEGERAVQEIQWSVPYPYLV